MARTTWKRRERQAAAMFGGTRAPANTGGPFDFCTDAWVGQVKERRRLSLAELSALCEEMERLGAQMSPPRLGVVVVKHSAGRGRATPFLVCATEHVWRECMGRMPNAPIEEAAPSAPRTGENL